MKRDANNLLHPQLQIKGFAKIKEAEKHFFHWLSEMT